MVSEVKTYRNKTNIEITECHEGNSKACSLPIWRERPGWRDQGGYVEEEHLSWNFLVKRSRNLYWQKWGWDGT